MRIDDNIELINGETRCMHCGELLGHGHDNPLANAIINESPSKNAGPNIHVDPVIFVDRKIVLRQFFCPKCLALLLTEIVPADEPSFRTWRVSQ